MRTRSLAHLSDLHLGLSPRTERAAAALCEALIEAGVDHVLVTGDVANRGKLAELAAFERAFAPLLDAGRLSVVPGNHDRLGDDVARWMMSERVEVEALPGLHLVRVDSTGPHNRSLLAGHGILGERDLEAIDAALDAAPPGALTVLALHHHPLPLPEEHFTERFSSWLGWPNAAELGAGPRLLERIRGRADLVLHGHRHAPSAFHLEGPRPLGIYNAGSSTQLARARVFTHVAGALAGPPRWLEAGEPAFERARPALVRA